MEKDKIRTSDLRFMRCGPQPIKLLFSKSWFFDYVLPSNEIRFIVLKNVSPTYHLITNLEEEKNLVSVTFIFFFFTQKCQNINKQFFFFNKNTHKSFHIYLCHIKTIFFIFFLGLESLKNTS
jgi:hypothetical protein